MFRTKKKKPISDKTMKIIVITTIKTNLSKDEVMRRAEERANHFNKVKGLIRKFWAHNTKDNIFHGIFDLREILYL